MKTIDEHYKDWCGESHTTNSCHPVHDSAECTDFAEYYAKQMQDYTIEKVKIAIEALDKIAHPILYLQKQADENGYTLDGCMAIRLTESTSFYIDIATKALDELNAIIE